MCSAMPARARGDAGFEGRQGVTLGNAFGAAEEQK